MSRDGTIHYTLQFDVADGKMAEFEALADEAIAYNDAKGALEGMGGSVYGSWKGFDR